MRHARLDYEGIQPFPTKREHIVCDAQGNVFYGIDADRLPDDEPVMVFRAKDKLAPGLVDHYAELLMEAGADKEMVDLVRRWANEMRAYAAEHYGGGSTPDVDKGWMR